MDKLSIVIPVFNAEKTIKRCVTSVLDQSYKDFELILVDDGSSDSSAEICDSFEDNRVKAFHIKNSGPGAARNFGMSKMSGRYLAFIDADDSIGFNTYMNCIIAMEENCCQMAVYPWTSVSPDKSAVVDLGYLGVFRADEVRRRIVYEDFIGGGGYPWCRVIDCSAIEKLPTFPEDIKAYEDKIWVYEVLRSMQNVYFMKDAGYQYFTNSDSLSSTPKIANAVDQLSAMQHMYKIENMFGGHGTDPGSFNGNVTNKVISLFFYYRNVKEQKELSDLWHKYRWTFSAKPTSVKCRIKDLLLRMKFE